MLAPCPHALDCPLASGGGRGWCRAAQRLVRPALARGAASGPGAGPPPHQDERFSYVAVMKAGGGEGLLPPPRPRVVAPPRRRGGHALLTTCTPAGALAEVTVAKSAGRALYRRARAVRWGGVWPPREGGSDSGSTSSSDDSSDGSESESESESESDE